MSQTSQPRRRNGLRRWFADRGVATKVVAGVAVLFVALATVATLALTRLSDMRDSAHRMHDEAMVPVIQLDEVRRAFLQTRLDALADQLTGTGVAGDEHQAYLKDIADVEAALAAYGRNELTAQERASYDALTTAWAGFTDVVTNELTPLGWEQRNSAAFRELRNSRVKPLSATVQGSLNLLIASAQERVTSRTAANDATYADARNTVLAASGLGLLLAGLLVVVTVRGITRPVRRVSTVLEALAQGDLTQSAEVDANDEIGRMAKMLDTALVNLRATVSAVAANAATMANSGERLTAVNVRMSQSARETSSQAQRASEATEQISYNVQSTAAGAEEMGASIRDIAANASQAADVAREAVDVAGSANATVTQLGVSSAEIGNVIRLITTIAEQTNLLALNATIEAARAGESGKGFAVVANEVKELAQETAKATDDISQRIQAIQGDAGQAVEAIARISDVIGRVNDYSMTIASAVEEQSATTNEMARSVNEASAGATAIGGSIGGVAAAAATTAEGLAESASAATDMSRVSTELNELVGRFRY